MPALLCYRLSSHVGNGRPLQVPCNLQPTALNPRLSALTRKSDLEEVQVSFLDSSSVTNSDTARKNPCLIPRRLQTRLRVTQRHDSAGTFPVTNSFMTRRCGRRYRNVDTDPCWVGVDSCNRFVTLPVFYQVCYSYSRWQTTNSLFHGCLEGFVAAIPENSTLSSESGM